MGVFDKFADTPDQIRIEGQEITIKFQRLSETTGRISWNIPPPAAGCNSDTQAYDGIVITVANQPANYLSNSPQDGTYYTGDPTADADVHAGDKLDGALVVGAFYNDKKTTFLDITDLKAKTPYYISGYAVDKVARYHREGVHAYSLPDGPQIPNNEKDLPAFQDIGIETQDGIGPSTLTGLKQGKMYFISVLINGKQYTLNIDGTLALDYDDLIYQINQEFIRLTEPKYSAPFPPHTDEYYVDINGQKVYKWTGYESIRVDTYFNNDDPSTPILGTFWYNPEDDILYERETSGWVVKSFKSSVYDFSDPKCYQFWFDGTNVYKWEKVLWCQLPTYVSDTNPLLPPMLDCNTFWYNTDSNLLAQWNIQTHAWDDVDAIYSDINPNSIPSGAYWYNQTDEKVYYFAASTWHELNNVTYVNPLPNGDFPNPTFANIYWFIPESQTLYRRNPSNTAWIQLDVILYVADPRDRTACQLWWDSGSDTLFIWDTVNTQWVEVSAFYQQAKDPSTPNDIPLNSAWYDPVTKVITIINNPDCTPVEYVFSETDPTVLVLGDIWYNPDTKVWNEWDGTGWQEIEVIIKTSDPYVLTVGELWFNTASNQLNQWNGTGWTEISYSTHPLTPKVGDLWYNVQNEKLYEWNGITWVETIGIASAKLVLRHTTACEDCSMPFFSFTSCGDGCDIPYPHADFVRFFTKATGCNQSIVLCRDAKDKDGHDMVFANLTQNVIYFFDVKGYSKLPSPPMYEQLGVGTDGNPSQRRDLHSVIRSSLGDPVMKVELTKEQIDICIDNALLELRKYSNLSVTREMFFLDINPRQQMYLLKDKCVGFNKIVDINALYRMRGGFFYQGGFGGDTLFGIAALQQLYQLGTFDMLSFHLVASYIEELQTLFADNIMFQWVERSRELRMYKAFYNRDRVLVDAVIERTEQDLLSSRDTRIWLQKWSIAEAKMMLSQSRGKFQTLPGPNGNTTLNAQDLIQQAQDEMNSLKEELSDLVMQDAVDIGMRTHFIIG
jgi:hypothetical protein